MKRCAHCKQDKDITKFSSHSKTKDKLQCWCKSCQTLYIKDRYTKNKDSIEYKAVRKMYARKFQVAHPGRKESYTTNWIIAHPEQIRKNRIKEANKIERLFASYQYGAKIRSLSFNITMTQFLSIISQRCHYCGSDASFGSGDIKLGKYNGIDRKDNNIGYELENCLPCCKFCNRAKHTSSYDMFIKWIKNIILPK